MQLKTIIDLILLILFAFTSIYIFLKFIKNLVVGINSLKWIKTKAAIKYIGIREGNTRGLSFYFVDIKYSYYVNNNKIDGNKYSYKFLAYIKRSNAEKVIKSITSKDFYIHYNPQNNNQSVVIPGPNYFINIAMLLLGIFCFYISVLYFVKF